MSDEHIFNFNINTEVDRFFDDSSKSNGEAPRCVILMGGPAAGKTHVRKLKYPTGLVLVDAAEIFLNLSRGEFFPFPDAFESPMDMIGGLIARRAVREQRHIVTELIGADVGPTKAMLESMREVGYHLVLEAITCDIEVAIKRNETRGDDNISCYYAEPYQRRWLFDAATEERSRQENPA